MRKQITSLNQNESISSRPHRNAMFGLTVPWYLPRPLKGSEPPHAVHSVSKKRSRKSGLTTLPQRPCDHISEYLFHRGIVIIHPRLHCPEILLLFKTFQMTEIQGRQAGLRRHHNGQHAGHATVSFPEGMNENQFRVDDSEGVSHFRFCCKQARGKSPQGILF